MRIHARYGILGLSRLGITLAACVCIALGTAMIATPSYAATAPGDVHTHTPLIDRADREAFGIKEVRWVEASGSAPPYAFILGCFACGPASYTSDGELADPASRPKIPTTSRRVPRPRPSSARVISNCSPTASR